jgi:hypothetical protein
LRFLPSKQIGDFLVGDFADLVIVLDELAVLVADTAASRLHQSIAGLVRCADVAVDTGPAFIAFAGRA